MIEPLVATVSIPGWMAALGAVAAVLAILLLIRSGLSSEPGSFATLAQIALVAVVGGAAYFGLRHLEEGTKRAERNAIEARAAALQARTAQPGSVLACIDGTSEPTLAEACERALFAEPQRVAAALTHIRERLQFLADAVGYANARDPEYLNRIRSLRDAVEADPYGLVAHVLISEDKCTAESCARFALLRENTRVKANIAEKRLEGLITKHAAAWQEAEKIAQRPATAGATGSVPEPESSAATAPSGGGTSGAAPTPAPQRSSTRPAVPPRGAAGTPRSSAAPAVPTAQRRPPEPVPGLPRVVPRRYEQEDDAPPQSATGPVPPAPITSSQ